MDLCVYYIIYIPQSKEVPLTVCSQIIEGAITVFIDLLAFLILPDFPSNTKWITKEERVVAEYRLCQDAAGTVD